MELLAIAPISGLVSIAAAVYLFFYVNKQKRGTKKMIEISEAIKIGANAYLKRQNITLLGFVLVMAIVLGVAFQSVDM